MIGGQSVRGVPRAVPSARAMTLRAWPLIIILVIGGWLCAKDINSESSVAARGDAARYLMNGAFFLDLARDVPPLTPASLLEWTRLYYARYPALSIGHHPVLLPVAEAAAFAAFGVSVSSARLLLLLFFLAALAFCYAMIRELYDDGVAFLATAIVATNPLVVYYGRSILSEIPALAFCLGAAYYLVVYERTGRRRHLLLLAASIVLGLYTKQLSAFLIPLAFVHLGLTRGWRHLISRPIILTAVTSALLILALVVMTLRMSPYNVKLAVLVATETDPQWGMGAGALFVRTLGAQSLGATALIAGAAAVAALVRRDRRILFFGLWILVVFGQLYLFTGGISPGRYAIYWIPAFAGLAASIVAHVSKREVRWALAVLVLSIAVRQAVVSANRPAPRSTGYDEAAAYVAAAGKGDSILFSGPHDTGLFVFGIRKRDPLRKMIVLRADKVLATSQMRDTVDRISRADEIYAALHRFGTAFVVVEDLPTKSPALELLRRELRSPRFAERRRMSVESTRAEMNGVHLVVYEYLHATPADASALLEMDLPVVGQSIKLRFGDLLDQSGQKR